MPEISEEEEKAVRTQPGRETEQLQAHYEIASHGEVNPAWIAKWLFYDGQIQLKELAYLDDSRLAALDRRWRGHCLLFRLTCALDPSTGYNLRTNAVYNHFWFSLSYLDCGYQNLGASIR